MDQVEGLRIRRRDALANLDELGRSIFLDMFGDPVTNPRNLPRRLLGSMGMVITGNTPPRSNDRNYGSEIEWIKSDNITSSQVYATKAKESLSEAGSAIARVTGEGSVLITCIAGSPSSIGNAALVDRKVAFNQQINAVRPIDVDPFFLFMQLVVGKKLVQAQSTGGMKGLVSKSRLEAVALVDPPLPLQREFSYRMQAVEQLKVPHRASLTELDALFASLQERAFRGAL